MTHLPSILYALFGIKIYDNYLVAFYDHAHTHTQGMGERMIIAIVLLLL